MPIRTADLNIQPYLRQCLGVVFQKVVHERGGLGEVFNRFDTLRLYPLTKDQQLVQGITLGSRQIHHHWAAARKQGAAHRVLKR